MQSVFEQEIASQGEVLRSRSAEGTLAARRAAELFDDSATHLVIAARGSSDNAARYLQYLSGRELGLLTALATPSLYVGDRPINLAGAVVLGISQSGQSPDIVSVMKAARQQGRPTISITNDVGSPLARHTDVVIPLLVGDEISLAATKTFLASLQAAAQLVRALAAPREPFYSMEQLPDVVREVSAWAIDAVGGAIESLALGGLTVVGRGLGLSSAEECALKIREVSGIRAEAYAAPDILHGPIGADGSGSTLWLQLTDEINDLDAGALLESAQQSGLRTLVSRGPSRAPTRADVEIVLPVVTENWVVPMLHVVIGQVLALRLGEIRQRPIDQPPGLQKITLTN
jgi:glucosamine--fructose-6-phosphate aminotransferase (isomerizing)